MHERRLETTILLVLPWLRECEFNRSTETGRSQIGGIPPMSVVRDSVPLCRAYGLPWGRDPVTFSVIAPQKR